MRSLRRAFLIPALALLVITVTALAYPKPASVPYRWELDFTPGALRLWVDPVDGRAYWYLDYAVLNDTGEDQLWAPRFVIYTDEGEILTSGTNVPGRVERELKDLLGNQLIELQNEVIGDLFQGKEHQKDGLAVWPARNLDVNEISLFISGISGETARVINPATGEEMILRKTLQRDYLVRGNAIARGSAPAELVDQRWVLR